MTSTAEPSAWCPAKARRWDLLAVRCRRRSDTGVRQVLGGRALVGYGSSLEAVPAGRGVHLRRLDRGRKRHTQRGSSPGAQDQRREPRGRAPMCGMAASTPAPTGQSGQCVHAPARSAPSTVGHDSKLCAVRRRHAEPVPGRPPRRSPDHARLLTSKCAHRVELRSRVRGRGQRVGSEPVRQGPVAQARPASVIAVTSPVRHVGEQQLHRCRLPATSRAKASQSPVAGHGRRRGNRPPPSQTTRPAPLVRHARTTSRVHATFRRSRCVRLTRSGATSSEGRDELRIGRQGPPWRCRAVPHPPARAGRARCRRRPGRHDDPPRAGAGSGRCTARSTKWCARCGCRRRAPPAAASSRSRRCGSAADRRRR